jgi:hypothetical protein
VQQLTDFTPILQNNILSRIFERFPRFQQIIILLDINALSVYMQIVTDDQHDERRNQGRIHTFESSLLPLVRLEY